MTRQSYGPELMTVAPLGLEVIELLMLEQVMREIELLLSAAPTRLSEPCHLQRIIDGLADPYKTALGRLVTVTYSEGGLSDIELAHVMRQAGLKIGKTAINYHRRAVCGCSEG